MAYTDSNLWQAAFGVQAPTAFPDERVRLQLALASMRDRATLLAARIATDLPDFTVHDATHMDALWEMADIVLASPEELNPVEVFVFGAAVLLHDLGLSVAAYPGGLTELRQTLTWHDAVGLLIRKRADDASAAVDGASELVERQADYLTLRRLHAPRAANLMAAEWLSADGQPIFLLDDFELREQFGWSIGQIAASHWWATDSLLTLGDEPLSAPLLPAEWSLDRIRVACLLRLADILHIDQRRAPDLNRSLQMPSRASVLHWEFQRRLARPTREGDVVVLSSSRPFPPDSASAWWEAWSAARAIDWELRAVDNMLIALNRKRFVSRAVRGIERPESFAKYVVADGWEPIQASVRVSNVAAVARTLGGVSLYGADAPIAPLRELIQNAMDAVRARRVLESDFDGVITVSIEGPSVDGDTAKLVVSDNGIGMTRSILADVLLDFGSSLWTSDSMLDLPRLAASAFDPIGKFGIGFFSAFIWGQRVRVVTRSTIYPQGGILVLEIDEGLDGPVVLRRVDNLDEMMSTGTRVSVSLETAQCDLIRAMADLGGPEPQKSEPISTRFYNARYWHGEGFGAPLARPRHLASFIGWFAPAADVRITWQSGSSRVPAIERDWWLNSDGEDLLRGLYPVANDAYDAVQSTTDEDDEAYYANEDLPISEVFRHHSSRRRMKYLESAVARLVTVRDQNGTPIARMAAAPRIENYLGDGLVATVGGLRVMSFTDAVGVALAHEPNAARNDARLMISREDLAAWASHQAELFDHQSSDMRHTEFLRSAEGIFDREMREHNDLLFERVDFAHFVINAGGHPGNLPVGMTSEGVVTVSTLASWIRRHKLFAVYNDDPPGRCASGILWAPLESTPWSVAGACKSDGSELRRSLDWLIALAAESWRVDRSSVSVSHGPVRMVGTTLIRGEEMSYSTNVTELSCQVSGQGKETLREHDLIARWEVSTARDGD